MNALVADTLTPRTRQKLDLLESSLAEMTSVAVAFSGGVDSTLLLKIAVDVLGGNCMAVSGLSETYAPEEISEAKSLAMQIGWEYVLLQTMELSDPRYADNTHQRCFFCKQELYGKIVEFAKTRAIAVVVDGTNADDAFDFRPGPAYAPREISASAPHFRKSD